MLLSLPVHMTPQSTADKPRLHVRVVDTAQAMFNGRGVTAAVSVGPGTASRCRRGAVVTLGP